MAHLEAALYTRLAGFAGLAALVAARIYPLVAPENAERPFVVFQRVSTPRASAMGSDPGLALPRLQITSWADDPLEAKDVKEQVRAALQRWRGTVAGVEVQDSYILDERDRYDEQTRLFGIDLDVRIPHREA